MLRMAHVDWHNLAERFLTQSPVFIIAVLGLVVAALALGFGLALVLHVGKRRE